MHTALVWIRSRFSVSVSRVLYPIWMSLFTLILTRIEKKYLLEDLIVAPIQVAGYSPRALFRPSSKYEFAISWTCVFVLFLPVLVLTVITWMVITFLLAIPDALFSLIPVLRGSILHKMIHFAQLLFNTFVFMFLTV